MTAAFDFRMPAEWEPHSATWISWPHHEPDWPGKIGAIVWVYTEIARLLSAHERVEILCHDDKVKNSAQAALKRAGLENANIRLHVKSCDRCWLRDSAPTGVKRKDGRVEWMGWSFNAWAKYDNFAQDREVPASVAKISGLPLTAPQRPDGTGGFVLEGGAIDTDGEGTLLVTEECLLSDQQVRNPGLDRAGYEEAFARYLGIRKTIWLDRGCVGDDTHGHIDDITRFIAPGRVLTIYESDPTDENHEITKENFKRLSTATDAKGRKLDVVKLPMPKALYFDGVRLPASYANFYIANGIVIVPTFNDENDREALNILAKLFPTRKVVGIHSVDLVWGFGTLHCLSQQQPA